MAEQAERDRRLLEEHFLGGTVASGFTYRFEIISDPVDRILFEIGNHEGVVLMRIWWEQDQFRQFAELVQQVAEDAYGFDAGDEQDV